MLNSVGYLRGKISIEPHLCNIVYCSIPSVSSQGPCMETGKKQRLLLSTWHCLSEICCLDCITQCSKPVNETFCLVKSQGCFTWMERQIVCNSKLKKKNNENALWGRLSVSSLPPQDPVDCCENQAEQNRNHHEYDEHVWPKPISQWAILSASTVHACKSDIQRVHYSLPQPQRLPGIKVGMMFKEKSSVNQKKYSF